jgi:hypothetical protein
MVVSILRFQSVDEDEECSMKADFSLVRAAGLLCAATAFAGVIASSLPVMSIGIIGGLVATAAALNDKYVAPQSTKHHHSIGGQKYREREAVTQS